MSTATVKVVPSGTEKNKQLVRGLYDAFKRGDISTLLAGLTANVEWITPGPPELSLAGHRKGRQEVSQFFQLLKEEEDFLEFEVHNYLAESDTVVALGHFRSKVPSTGRISTSTFAHVFTIVNGQVNRFEEYFDTASALLAHRSN
jgi:uncharacterized protein